MIFFTWLKNKQNFILLLFFSFILFYRLFICINYNPELSVGETNNIWNALNVANGKPLYTNPEDTPFEIFQYTPLSQLPVIAAAKYFNSTSENYAYYVMVLGRLFSLIFNILTFYIVYITLKNSLNVSRTLSLAAAITGFGLLTHLAFAIRPDAMSLFLTILSVCFFSKAYFQKQYSYYIYCGVTFGISFFAKQDSFLILSALGLFLLINKSWKELLTLAVSFLVSFVSLLFIFKVVFGNFFLFSIVGGLSQGYSAVQAYDVFKRFLTFYGVLLCIGITGIFVLVKNVLPEKRGFFLLILCMVSFLIAASSSLKLGSWMNYYTPFVIYVIILVYYVINYLTQKNNRRQIETIIVCATIIYISVFLYLQVFHYTAPFLKYSESKKKYASIAEKFNDFKKEVEANNSIVFTFDKRIKLLLFKNTIFPNTEYYHHTLFSYDGYNKLNDKQKLAYYIFDSNLNGEQLSALNYYKVPLSSFIVKEKKMNYVIYKYNPQ